MKTTIATKDLIGLLIDLIQTVGDGPLGAVHLRTMAGYWRDEPGRTNLLAGVSSSGVVGGHTWALASGTIEPTAWSIDDARAVIAVFKPAVKMHGPNHTVDIEVDSERHITVRETPALFDAGSELAFTGWDPAEFPYGPITNAPATGRHLAQIGDEWRGFIFARTVDPDEVDLVEPTSDLNVEAATEDSESAVAEWSERMRKGLGIPPIPPADDEELPDDGDPETEGD